MYLIYCWLRPAEHHRAPRGKPANIATGYASELYRETHTQTGFARQLSSPAPKLHASQVTRAPDRPSPSKSREREAAVVCGRHLLERHLVLSAADERGHEESRRLPRPLIRLGNVVAGLIGQVLLALERADRARIANLRRLCLLVGEGEPQGQHRRVLCRALHALGEAQHAGASLPKQLGRQGGCERPDPRHEPAELLRLRARQDRSRYVVIPSDL